MYQVEVITKSDKVYLFEADSWELSGHIIYFSKKINDKESIVTRWFNFDDVSTWRFIENENH